MVQPLPTADGLHAMTTKWPQQGWLGDAKRMMVRRRAGEKRVELLVDAQVRAVVVEVVKSLELDRNE